MKQLQDLQDAIPTDEEVAALDLLMYKGDEKAIITQGTLSEALPSKDNPQDDTAEYEANAVTGLTISTTRSFQVDKLPEPPSGLASSKITDQPQRFFNREFVLPQVMPHVPHTASRTASKSSDDHDAKCRALPSDPSREASKKTKRASRFVDFHTEDEQPTSSEHS
ncbi:MAG: hypothetical protein LQ347_004645 [Umbilicaria vellea]|nr:MAG: hypothetical protein LQ347_004645 [Umbilicaria vellea]